VPQISVHGDVRFQFIRTSHFSLQKQKVTDQSICSTWKHWREQARKH